MTYVVINYLAHLLTHLNNLAWRSVEGSKAVTVIFALARRTSWQCETHTSTSKKNGNRQADRGRQAFNKDSRTENDWDRQMAVRSTQALELTILTD